MSRWKLGSPHWGVLALVTVWPVDARTPEEKALAGAIDDYLRLAPDAPEAETLQKQKADLLAR